MPRGGARQGTGPKKGSKHKKTLEKEEALEYIRKRVSEELEPIMDVAIAQAKIFDPAGNVARKDLFDRAYGKPKESIEHSGEVKVTEVQLDI